MSSLAREQLLDNEITPLTFWKPFLSAEQKLYIDMIMIKYGPCNVL
jgi:hypothetical protein